jgi:hypothetical protein
MEVHRRLVVIRFLSNYKIKYNATECAFFMKNYFLKNLKTSNPYARLPLT